VVKRVGTALDIKTLEGIGTPLWRYEPT
jgi:hypothetical protein